MWLNKNEKHSAEEGADEHMEAQAAQSGGGEFHPEKEKSTEEVEQELAKYIAEDHTSKKQKRTHKKWSRKKKLITAGIAVAVVFVVFRSCGGKKEVLPTAVAAPLAKGDVTAVLSLNGPISGTESADVVSNIHAEVLSISVKEGDRVEKGQTLALIDSTDLQKAVDVAQNAYDLAVSEYNESIRDTQNNYEKALQDYNTAKLNYDRNKVLFEVGDISAADLETLGNALNDARRQVETFTIEGGRAVPDQSYALKVKSAQFELDQKKTDLDNAEVKSPITGTVVRVNSKVGQFADKPEDEKPMFVVENLDELEMEIAVSEYSIGSVSVGQAAEISADILGENTVTGEITNISPTGEEKGGGSSERVVPATIRIDGGSGRGLIAGITARASIVTGEAQDVFIISQSALVQNEDGTLAVAAIDMAAGGTDGTVRMIPVKVGVESDLNSEIIPVEEGALTEGMLIAMAPAGLTDGMTVMVRTQ